MGEAAACDESLIPPAVGYDDPNYIERWLQDISGSTTRISYTQPGERYTRYDFPLPGVLLLLGAHIKHGDAALRDTLMGIVHRAFAEDRTMIEAQQRVMDMTAAPRIMPTSADRAITLCNQMIARRVREESNLAQPRIQGVGPG